MMRVVTPPTWQVDESQVTSYFPLICIYKVIFVAKMQRVRKEQPISRYHSRQQYQVWGQSGLHEEEIYVSDWSWRSAMIGWSAGTWSFNRVKMTQRTLSFRAFNLWSCRATGQLHRTWSKVCFSLRSLHLLGWLFQIRARLQLYEAGNVDRH